MEIAELAFIPTPGAGHLAPMVELARVITSRDNRISATVFIMEPPFQSKLKSYTQTLLSNQPPPRVRFIHLTLDEPTSETLHSVFWLQEIVKINKSRVKDFYSSEPTHRLKAFVVDMFCTAFDEVASEFGVPSYVFFTSNACFLSLMFYLQSLKDDQNQDITELNDSDTELAIPGFMNPVPPKVLPYAIHKGSGWSDVFVNVPRMMRKTKGILVNTFEKLESYTIKCLSEDKTIPPVYPVGPVLNLKAEESKDGNDLERYETIITWLDNQAPASVVFLCFGSMGTFEAEQVGEIAHALEQSGHGFLWALRKPPPKDNLRESPTEYENLNDVLPEGFFDRTKEIGKIIGWAPQIAVLSHPAVGGFVSHCGWNSTMESLWYGVPIATWPLYAEQQINAFEMVKEWGLAVEITLDYQRMDPNPIIVSAEEIKRGIKQLMEGSVSTEIKKKVKAMKEESRGALVEGGSSYAAIGNFIEEVLVSSR